MKLSVRLGMLFGCALSVFVLELGTGVYAQDLSENKADAAIAEAVAEPERSAKPGVQAPTGLTHQAAVESAVYEAIGAKVDYSDFAKDIPNISIPAAKSIEAKRVHLKISDSMKKMSETLKKKDLFLRSKVKFFSESKSPKDFQKTFKNEFIKKNFFKEEGKQGDRSLANFSFSEKAYAVFKEDHVDDYNEYRDKVENSKGKGAENKASSLKLSIEKVEKAVDVAATRAENISKNLRSAKADNTRKTGKNEGKAGNNGNNGDNAEPAATKDKDKDKDKDNNGDGNDNGNDNGNKKGGKK